MTVPTVHTPDGGGDQLDGEQLDPLYQLLITQHRLGKGAAGKKPPVESRVLFRGIDGQLSPELLKQGLAPEARVYVRHLATRLSVQVKGSGPTEGIELFPKQDFLEEGQFGNALRGPLGVHRGAARRYWFYGAPYNLEAQIGYLHSLRRVSEQQLDALIAGLPPEPQEDPRRPRAFNPERPHFEILDYIETRRKVGRMSGR